MSEENLKWNTVDSSFVEAIAYDEPENELYVTLTHGSYVYQGVPSHVFDDFLKAESKGTFFNMRVKDVYAFMYR